MNTLLNRIFRHPLHSLLKLACVGAVLTGCGGGGDSGTTSTTSFASGPITGLGSIIVNGVRFDDSTAKVSSDDDDDSEVHNRNELKLGMMVEVQGGATRSDDSGRHSKANEIHFGSEIVGPVGTVGTNTFTILGQTVNVSATTLYDDSLAGGFGAIAAGAVLEVHGIFDTATKVYNATRIEPKSAAALFKIRGAIENLTATTFVIGGETISYASLVPQPNGLANGQIVRVKLQTSKNGAGAWIATKIRSGVRKVEAHDEAEIKGTITRFASGTDFDVNGLPVDATGVTNRPAGLAMGVSVEIHGSSSNGKIIATRIEIEDRNKAGAGEFEFHDTIKDLVQDAGNAKTFVVKGWTIGVETGTTFEKGATAQNLANGACVEVKATTVSSSTALRAVRIRFDNSCTP